ncbi:MAG: hypothetical protein RUMPE_00103 [Eubacteriales bacterium SKADARSKE-1]|nr:hypothetical protein [Eubacteriales bacterium SKADARSKE-1]
MDLKEKKPIIVLNSKWKKESYKNVMYTCEKKSGVLKRRMIGISFYSVIFAGFLFLLYFRILGRYEVSLSSNWHFVCGILFSLISLYYYVMFLPKLIKKQAEKVFDSNKILQLPFKVSFFEDRFLYENEIERLVRYWTDILFCIETDEIFVIKDTGNIVFILEKSDLSKKEIEDTANFLRDKLVNRYTKRSNL